MKSNIFKLQLASFLNGLAFFTPVMTLYFLRGGVALPAIVISQVFYLLFLFVGDIPTGIFADKIGHKYAQLVGYFLNIIKYAVFLVMPNTFGLYLAYSLGGFGDSFLSGSGDALLYESSENGKYKRHASQLLANETMGFAFGAAVGGLVLAGFGASSYTYILWLSILGAALAFAAAATLKQPKLKPRVAASSTKALSIFKQGFSVIRRNRTVRALMWVTILTLSGEYFLYNTYQPYFELAHVPPVFFGLVLSIGAVLNYVVVRYSYLLEKWFPLEKIILIVNSVLALGYLVMAMTINPILLIGSFIMLKGFFNASSPVMNDYIHENTESDIRATVISGISQIKSFVQIGTRILLGVLVGAIGLSHTYLAQGIYLVLGIALAYYIMVRCGCTHRIHGHTEDFELESGELER